MRNNPPRRHGAWSTYAKAAREGAYKTISELARQLNINRTTLYRWETGDQQPHHPAIVIRFAQAVGVDTDEALAAAGLRPGVAPPSEPTRLVDDEIEIILQARVCAHAKKAMVDRLMERREREKQLRVDEIRFWIAQHMCDH